MGAGNAQNSDWRKHQVCERRERPIDVPFRVRGNFSYGSAEGCRTYRCVEYPHQPVSEQLLRQDTVCAGHSSRRRLPEARDRCGSARLPTTPTFDCSHSSATMDTKQSKTKVNFMRQKMEIIPSDQPHQSSFWTVGTSLLRAC